MPGNEKRCYSSAEYPLSVRGEKQARQLRSWAQERGISLIAASPSGRCVKTAELMSGVKIEILTDEALREVLPLVDLVLVMSVEPGFGGQSFIPGSLEKIAQLRAMAREMGLETIIEVDGGISARNAGAVYGAGADVLVAGSSVFGAEDPQAEVVKMLNA